MFLPDINHLNKDHVKDLEANWHTHSYNATVSKTSVSAFTRPSRNPCESVKACLLSSSHMNAAGSTRQPCGTRSHRGMCTSPSVHVTETETVMTWFEYTLTQGQNHSCVVGLGTWSTPAPQWKEYTWTRSGCWWKCCRCCQQWSVHFKIPIEFKGT